MCVCVCVCVCVCRGEVVILYFACVFFVVVFLQGAGLTVRVVFFLFFFFLVFVVVVW